MKIGKTHPLSEWPVYPGGAISGVLLAVAAVLLFLVDIPALQHSLPAVRVIVVVLWAISVCRN